jgi:hypothetical protein
MIHTKDVSMPTIIMSMLAIIMNMSITSTIDHDDGHQHHDHAHRFKYHAHNYPYHAQQHNDNANIVMTFITDESMSHACVHTLTVIICTVTSIRNIVTMICLIQNIITYVSRVGLRWTSKRFVLLS